MVEHYGNVYTSPRLLARLTVKGNFIWAEPTTPSEPLRYLDGDSFGKLGSDGRTAIVYESGDGRPGGDFEMWFWVVPKL